VRSGGRFWILGVLACAALGTVAWAGLTPVGPELREVIYVIPKGTWARKVAGEKFDTLPPVIHLTLGIKDVLVMKNEDDVPQMFGPVLMMPGQGFRLPFNVASRYDFACTAHVNGTLTVFVAPKPRWWELALWRASSMLRMNG